MVPLFLNYHVYKNRFEWTYSLGVALDVINIEVNEDTFELHENGRLISEPIANIPSEGLFIQPHFITKVGLRYHINEKLNVGWNTSINLLNVPLSNMDLGLYYRF